VGGKVGTSWGRVKGKKNRKTEEGGVDPRVDYHGASPTGQSNKKTTKSSCRKEDARATKNGVGGKNRPWPTKMAGGRRSATKHGARGLLLTGDEESPTQKNTGGVVRGASHPPRLRKKSIPLGRGVYGPLTGAQGAAYRCPEGRGPPIASIGKSQKSQGDETEAKLKREDRPEWGTWTSQTTKEKGTYRPYLHWGGLKNCPNEEVRKKFS